jgi:hypothetical protein
MNHQSGFPRATFTSPKGQSIHELARFFARAERRSPAAIATRIVGELKG